MVKQAFCFDNVSYYFLYNHAVIIYFQRLKKCVTKL